MNEPKKRKWSSYKEGELETILSLVPTSDNIKRLSQLLDRSEEAIEIVYRIAYENGPFGDNADVQVRKILKAKEDLGIKLGRKKPKKKR